MQEFKQRVVDEHRELFEKAKSLENFISHSPIYAKLPEDEMARLLTQMYIMRAYATILEARIAHF